MKPEDRMKRLAQVAVPHQVTQPAPLATPAGNEIQQPVSPLNKSPVIIRLARGAYRRVHWKW